MIRTRGLSYTYATGGAAPLRFPDVDLRQGGTLLLRGRSGTGKSTWLALMAGLRGSSGGDLFVAGTQLGTQRGADIDAWRARTIGFLPQKLYLSSALTVADNLALAYFAAGLPRDDAAITRALAQVGVAELAARKPHQLSGGRRSVWHWRGPCCWRRRCCWPTSPRPVWTTKSPPTRWRCCSAALPPATPA